MAEIKEARPVKISLQEILFVGFVVSLFKDSLHVVKVFSKAGITIIDYFHSAPYWNASLGSQGQSVGRRREERDENTAGEKV